MSHKGERYTYKLKTQLPQEIAAVGDAYQAAGWIEVDFIPKEGTPTHIIFEWLQDSFPIHPPPVDFPKYRR